MSEALGDKLRQAREARGMTLDQLAAVTKLNPQFIEALEKGRWDLLPGQVYLKPFVKACAEALNLDLKELYALINGKEMEKRQDSEVQAETPEQTRRFDYRIPVVIVIALIVVGLIYFTVRSRQGGILSTGVSEIIPAESVVRKQEAKWNRPWERPARWESGEVGHRLRLEAIDTVWVCVLTDGDTTFTGILNPGAARTFTTNGELSVNVGKNDCIIGYFDGVRIPEMGTGVAGPRIFRMNQIDERSHLER